MLTITEPRLERQPERPYMAIHARATGQELPTLIPQLFDEVFAWLGAHGVEPEGAPLIRYVVVDMDRQLEIEVGAQVKDAVAGDDRVKPGVLPAGTYATLVHTGDYSNLVDATAALLEWGRHKGIQWQTSRRGDEEVWDGRFELYLTDPGEEPNPEKWETRLAFLVRDTK